MNLDTVSALVIAALFTCSCSGGQSNDASADQDEDIADPPSDETSTDPPEEPDGGDLDASDATECRDAEDFVADTSGWDVDSYLPARAGRDCGPGCRQVSFAEDDVWMPNFEVWGRYLVIGTARDYSPVLNQILAIDLVSLEHYVLESASETDGHGAGWAEIFFDTVLYIHQQGLADLDLYLFDMSTGTTSILLDSTYDGAFFPHAFIQMECSAVVYENAYATGRRQLVLLDLHTLERVVIPTTSGGGIEPRIHNQRVAFQEGYLGHTHVGIYSIEEDRLIWQMEDPWDSYSPDIHGDIVVWGDTRAGGRIEDPTHGNIYMVDLSTGIESPVCEHPASQPGGPTVWGTKVAWEDLRNDPVAPNSPTMATEVDIYVMDLETGIEQQVSAMPGWEYFPKLHNDRVYYLAPDESGIVNVFEVTL